MYEIHEEVFKLLMDYHTKDENFLFTLRQINRGGKLDKGYWFLGNDDYLAVSFWHGTDRVAKSPRVFFKIDKNGNSSLELISEDGFRHIDFFDCKLLDDLNLKYNKYKANYTKNYEGDNYLNLLSEFINSDKKVIDKFVKDNDRNSYSEWFYPLEFINISVFERQLKKINLYREFKTTRLQNSGNLNNITIQNFGLIKNITINKISRECKWIFLTGENGSGKTTLLRAIAIGLCQNNDIDEIIADSTFGDFKIEFQLNNFNGPSKRHSVKYSDKISANSIIQDKVFAAYGPVRLLTSGELDSNIFKDNIDVHKKKTYGLFNPVGILRDLSGGYSPNISPRYGLLTINDLIENLEYIIPNIYKIEGNEIDELIFFEFGDSPNEILEGVPFSKLPSGTRNFVALVLDLLIRFQDQQPKVRDLSDYTGIVLIDEIDIHLHPKLQIEIVKQLSETFPKVQFIVSTHSPIPILGAPEHSIFLKISKTQKDGVVIERMDDKIPVNKLLPNALLNSPIFDLEDISPINQELRNIRTEDNFEEAFFNYMLQKKVDELKKGDS